MPPDTTVPAAPRLARLNDVELMHAGTWAIALGGEQTFTRDDFAAAIDALSCPAIARPHLKLGHFDPRWDGEPAVGWVDNMRMTDSGRTLTCDWVGMPDWLGQIAASAYPSRSVEGCRNFRCQIGHTHKFVLTAVALLGVTPPGIGTLDSLQDHPSLTDHVRALYGVAASADDEPGGEPVTVTIHATKEEAPVPDSRPELVAAAVTVDELRTAFHSQAAWDFWITEIQLDPLQLIVTSDSNGETYRVPVSIGTDGDSFVFGAPVAVEVTYVDSNENEPVAAAAAKPKPLAVVFASRAESRPGEQPQEVAASWPEAVESPAVAAAPASSPVAPEPPAPPAPTPQSPEPTEAPETPASEPEPSTPENEEDPEVSTLSEIRSRLGLPDDADEAAVLTALEALKEPKPDPQAVAAAAKRDEAFVAMKGELERQSAELAAIKAEKAEQAKQAFFAAARRDGKIRPADMANWEARYDKDPELVTEIIDAMAVGSAVPVAAAGYTGSPDDTSADDPLITAFDNLLSPQTRAALKG